MSQAAVSARVALLDAGGDADTETAIGIALAGVAPGTAGCPLLMSRLAPGSGKAAGSASVAATECIARLGLAGAGAGAGAGPAARLVRSFFPAVRAPLLLALVVE